MAAPVVSNIVSPFPNLIPTTKAERDLKILQFELGNIVEDHVDSLSIKTNPSTFFGVLTPSTIPVTTTTSVAPKMDQMFATSLASIISTYTGAFDFLEDSNQAIFASTFGVNPTPFCLKQQKSGYQ